MDYELLCYLRKRMRFDAEAGIFYWLEWKEKFPWSQKFKGKEVGSKDKDGYRVAMVSLDGKRYCLKLHRVAWAFHHDQIPAGEIDHVNHCRWDNRPENLRLVSRAANTKNLSWNSRNTSGYLGVSKSNRKGNLWRARVRMNKREVVIGHFETPEEANEALQKVKATYGYHQNHGDAT